MSIQLVTYANQTVTPTNDAIIYEKAIDQNGIFYGCNVTVSGNEVHITGGYGIVCGREFTIQSESIAVTLAPSGTLLGRLYIRLDLADADAPIQLLTATGNTLPPLEQDSDVNYTNGTYEMELATFTIGVSALSDVVETFESVVGTMIGQKVDYIVGEGISGIWTYKKWNSGLYECYAFYNFTSYAVNTARGSLYSGAWVSVALPASEFVASPNVTATLALDTTANATFVQIQSVSSTSISMRMVSSGSMSASSYAYAHIQVKGKWK